MTGFVEFTLKDGSKILVNREWVASATNAKGELRAYGSDAVQCVLTLGGQTIAVKESYDTVCEYLAGQWLNIWRGMYEAGAR